MPEWRASAAFSARNSLTKPSPTDSPAITTMITAVVLFEYGTGPIKGFAVTLAIGLIATVFQALVVNRMLFQVYPGNRPVATLSI